MTISNQYASLCEDTFVRGNSMLPTLKNTETVTVCKNRTLVQNGDIIAFRLRDTYYVKRVIALPWDRVIFGKDGYIYRNDIRLDESYVRWNSRFNPNSLRILLVQLENYGQIVPPHMILVLGDNRMLSLDSGEYGMIDFEQVIGHVFSSAHS